MFLEAESKSRTKYLKAYFIYGDDNDYQKSNRESKLASLGKELGLEHVALTFVPSFNDSESEVDLNRINPQAANTILIYKRSRIVDKFINLKQTGENFNQVRKRLDATINEYFALPKPSQD